MNALAFDTHAHVKRLVGAGMSESQAEAVIEALRQTAELPDISHLATKADLQVAKSDLQAAVGEIRLATKADLQVATSDLQAAISELRLATKADLQTTKSDLQAGISEVRAELTATRGELRGEIKGVRGELIWWIIGTGVASWAAHLFIR